MLISRDIWVTLVGLCLAGLALAWVWSIQGIDAGAAEDAQVEPNMVPAG